MSSGHQRHDGVLVVGGGYAGLHAVRAADGLGVDTAVVDRTGDHDFVTRLAAVAGGTAPPGDARQPLSEFVKSVDTAAVDAVGDGVVELDDGRTVEADAVVVTAGSVPSRPPIDGIEHAAPLRSAVDALMLRALIADASSVVIIGGGATGVQLAGAVAHVHPSIDVHLVESGPRLLAGLPNSLGRGAHRILTDRGVRIHLDATVEQITENAASTTAGEIEGLVVWAGGFAADARRLGLPTDANGRVRVEPDLRIEGFERTFAAGDIAAHADRSGGPLPMSAQVAVSAGTAAGRNAARIVRDEQTERADLDQLGWVLDLGGQRGLAQVGPIALAGPIADLLPPILHDVIDLKNLIEIGGPGAVRFAPASVRSLMPRFPGHDVVGIADRWLSSILSPTTT